MVWSTVILVFLLIKLIVNVTNARCESKVYLGGKTALITGGNSGLGLQLAKELASRGCKIIIADRDDASKTVKNLIKETHNPNISCKMVNFASFKSVRLLAEEIKKDISKLEILVNNAGIVVAQHKMTEDGLQGIMQINYFSHFLLTHLLLDVLIKSSPSRIIYTSSNAAYGDSPLTKDNLKAGKIEHHRILYGGGPYGNSKIAGAMMSKMLAKKLNGTGVTSNAFHPGIVKTKIWTKPEGNEFIMFYLWWAWAILFGKNIDEGVQTMLYLACADEVEQISGKFFKECSPVAQPTNVYSDKLCEEIWSLSEEYVRLEHDEKIDRIIEMMKNN